MWSFSERNESIPSKIKTAPISKMARLTVGLEAARTSSSMAQV
jgi:hypothetical protein